MTTIQDRIIKQLDNNKNLFDWQKPELKQFLIQSIKEVEEETRKEEKSKFDKHCDNCVLYETKKLLSITNKDK